MPESYGQFQASCAKLVAEFRGPRLVNDVNRNLASLIENGRLADGSSARGLSYSSLRPLEVTVDLHKADDSISPLYEVSRHVFFASFGPSPIEVEVYDLPSLRPDVLRQDRVPQLSHVLMLHSGDTISAEAHKQIIRFRVPANDTIVVGIHSPVLGGFTWEYDVITHRPLRLLNSTVAETRIQYAARALAELGDDGSIPALDPLLDHPNYAIRWEALSALVRLDPGSAFQRLTALSADPHPLIRAAAIETIANNPFLAELF